MEKNLIKVGLVGLGYFGLAHLDNLLRLDREEVIKLVGICDKRAEALEKARTRLSAAPASEIKIVRDFSELLDMADVADIVTPTPTHFPLASQALNRGRHIFMEKPLAYTLREAEGIQNLAREKGLKVGVGYLIDFSPAINKLIEFLNGQKFLKAVTSHSEWCKNRITLSSRPTAGDLKDEATHPLRTILNILGTLQSVKKIKLQAKLTFCNFVDNDAQRGLYRDIAAFYSGEEMTRVFGSEEDFVKKVDAETVVLLETDQGANVFIHSSFISSYQRREIHLSLAAKDGYVSTGALLEFDVKTAGAPKDRLTITSYRKEFAPIVFEAETNRLYDELKAFFEWVAGAKKDPRLATAEDGVRENKILEACVKSNQKKGFITIKI